jgi:hypothetical protein
MEILAVAKQSSLLSPFLSFEEIKCCEYKLQAFYTLGRLGALPTKTKRG